MRKINEDDLLIAKVMDKKKQCERTNKLTYTDFLNEREQMIVLKNIKLENAFFFGGNYNSERKILIFYPNKLNEEMARKNIDSILSVIRIELPNENKGKRLDEYSFSINSSSFRSIVSAAFLGFTQR